MRTSRAAASARCWNVGFCLAHHEPRSFRISPGLCNVRDNCTSPLGLEDIIDTCGSAGAREGVRIAAAAAANVIGLDDECACMR